MSRFLSAHLPPFVLHCVTISATTLGCAANTHLAPMDPSQRIETENGYRQHGEQLDVKAMGDALEREPDAGPHARRSKVVGTLAVALAGIGGGLIGWPLGEKAGGSENPHWGLAYAGAGAAVLSIPLLIWSVSSLSSAVDAHNRSVGTPATSRDAASSASLSGPRPLFSW